MHVALSATWRCRNVEPVEWVGNPDLSECVSQRVHNLTHAYQRLFDNVLNVIIFVCYAPVSE